MKLTKENFNKVFNFIDDQVNSNNGEFDKQTCIVDAVKRTVEMLEDDNPNSVGYYGYNQKTDNYYPNLDD